MKKIFSDKAFVIELIGFVLLQIFIDMYRTFFESKYQLLGLSLPELINLGYIAFLSLIFFIKNLKTPKRYIPLIVYLVLFLAYCTLHVLNVLNFDQTLLTGSEPNWFKEIYFIVRTYLIPILLCYYFLCSTLTLPVFKKTISITSLIISLNIILTNIFKISFICYASALEKNTFITRNFFEWFFNPDLESPMYMTSKGWFYMGNQIGITLFMLFVFVLMNALESGKIKHYVLVFLNGLALVMIGTKVSTLGCCIVLFAGILFALLFGIWLKQFSFKLKHFAAYTIITVLLCVSISYSPMYSVQQDRNEAAVITEEQKEVTEILATKLEEIIQQENDNQQETPDNSITSAKKEEFKKEFSDYLNSAPYFFGIHPDFLKIFPVEENFDFWYDIAINGNNQQIDYRYLKTLIHEKVLDENHNETSDRLLGIGYVSNFPYSERDFVSQNIWFGYLGTLLLIGPYLLIIAYGIFLALKKIKTCFTFQNAFFALAVCGSIAISYLAGHLFYGIFSITIFAYISAAFHNYQKER